MPIVRLSGRVIGKEDKNRKSRAELLYVLFDAGWDIYNGNGDQVITLDNIQEKIIESDAFVFTQGAMLEDMFNAASIFVGFQTNDGELKNKPAVILNPDGSWDMFVELIEHLHAMGTVKEHWNTYLTQVTDTKDAVDVLESIYKKRKRKHIPEPDIDDNKVGSNKLDKPEVNVCVFCSASIEKEDYLNNGYDLGKELAENGFGCISGAGATGIMGEVVRGAVENGGWTGGSNVPHIVEMEGLPDGLNTFWSRGDIYTRMEVMIEESDFFVIMPGGMGTVQELLALVLLKEQKHDLMRGKNIIVVNKKDSDTGKFFWEPLLKMLEIHGGSKMYTVVDDSSEIIKAVKKIKG